MTADDTPIKAEDIEEYINTQDDFGLELRAFRACKERGFEVSHGGTYEDPVTKKTRQYDLRVSGENQKRSVQMPVECKNLKESHPLVVLRAPRTVNESYLEIVIHHDLDGLRSTSRSVRVNNRDLYKPGEPVGKAMRQIGRQNGALTGGRDSEVFDRWSQALSSAYDLVASAVSGRPDRPWFCSITMPALVVSNRTLWTVDYDGNGVPSAPMQVNECAFYIGKRYDVAHSRYGTVAHTITHLHIFTFDGFMKQLGRLSSNPKYWDLLFPEGSLRG
jgi:hypothetical protein